MRKRGFIFGRNGRKNAALRQRTAFLLLSAALLTALAQTSRPPIQEVHLSPEIRQILGEESDVLFNRLFRELQIWYRSYRCTENGVTLTKENDFQKILHLLECLGAYLNSREFEENDPDLELVREYNAKMGFAIVQLTLALMMILAEAETYTISKDGWQGLGVSIDDLIDAYK